MDETTKKKVITLSKLWNGQLGPECQNVALQLIFGLWENIADLHRERKKEGG